MKTFKFAALTILLSCFAVPFRSHAQQQVVLGNATVALTGPWKFHIGDNMAWAQAGFDDSAWGTMDLTPPPGSYDPSFGTSGYIPGWTVKGYPGYSGYAWYRLQTDVQNGQSALALKMPDNFDDGYQVYVNGQRIGQFGRFTSHGVTSYINQPRAFALPANLHSGPVTLAIRMWMGAETPLAEPDSGGLHGPPVLGDAAMVNGSLQLDWDGITRSVYSEFLEMVLLILALIAAFGLFWQDRSEPAYLWLGLTLAATLADAGILVASLYTVWLPGGLVTFLLEAILMPMLLGLWVVFWAYWFRLEKMVRLHRVVWILVVLLGLAGAMLQAPLYGSVIPVHATSWLSPVTVWLRLLLGALLVWVTVRGIRRNKTEGWVALPAVVLMAVAMYQPELAKLHVRRLFFPFGFAISLGQIATMVSLFIIVVLLLRRFLQSQREREQWRLEIEQARQMQHMLIPEALPMIPGFTLESEYRPAQQVGGDFFQIIEGDDNSILIVVGDVSGKGLKAAMLVSLIVGTIRTLAKFTRDPIESLGGLNERLCGRMQGHFATCVVAHIAPNGETTVANAGHLAPYLKGQEIAIAGSLPLGIIEAAEFSQITFHLRENDRLTFMTDGIVEAQDEKSELFGFERTQQMGNQPAAAIAEAAQKFGQQDDITVVSVVRSSVKMGAPGSRS
jgi:hypothetical protein